jgi:aspartate/methionine/tyrosine aminotransferase
MRDFHNLSIAECTDLCSKLEDEYNQYKLQKMSLDMSRGKPSPEQLDLSNGMLDVVTSADVLKLSEGTDYRNYGGISGIPEAKQLFAQMLDVRTQEIIIGGNSSLSMMYDAVTRAMLYGVLGSDAPWGKLQTIKFLCPSPGYDRHFAICELLNIEMIVVEMKHDGPDMNRVEELVAQDESIKGIWCVPKYSNPEGTTYSDEVVDRLAKMNTKARDFRIFWDDAYIVHHLTSMPDQLKNILSTCKKVGNPDRVFMFSSTSKISFAGSGVAMMAASVNNIDYISTRLAVQTIGPDKLNQLRHVRFFKNMENIEAHMKKHAAIIKPKFDKVLDILELRLGHKNIASWSKPKGGYFIRLNTMNDCAKAVVSMASDAGVKLTEAGATFPYGKDPHDRNIRIAPTFPSLTELVQAAEVLCLYIQIVSLKKILSRVL